MIGINLNDVWNNISDREDKREELQKLEEELSNIPSPYTKQDAYYNSISHLYDSKGVWQGSFEPSIPPVDPFLLNKRQELRDKISKFKKEHKL